MQNEYGPKGFQALGAAFNEADGAMAAQYISQYKVGFPVGPVVRDTVLSFMGFSLMDRLVVPQIAIVDKKGQIREQTEANPSAPMPLQDEAHLRSMIEKLLAEGGSGKAAPATGSNKAAPKKPVS
jgi:hypothetical protein